MENCVFPYINWIRFSGFNDCFIIGNNKHLRDKMKIKRVNPYDEQGTITTLGELLSCPRCGEPFVEIDKHTFKPYCDCIKKQIRISVG